MEGLIIMLAFFIIFIVIFFFCMKNLYENTNENNNLQPKDIELYKENMNSYVKFAHMIPNVDKLDVYVGNIKIFSNKSYGYVSKNFKTIKSGRNEVKVYVNKKLFLTQKINFQPYQYEICILYNFENIFKTKSLNKIRVFNAIKSNKPLTVTWKNGSDYFYQQMNTGNISEFKLNNGTYDVTVKDDKKKIIYRQKITVDYNKCKIYALSGSLMYLDSSEAPKFYLINGACGYLGNQMENLLEPKDLENKNFYDENELEEWDNESNDISDFNY